MKIIVIAILLVIVSPIIFLIAAVIESAKYDYILEKDEQGNWSEVPVFHPCGEVIDEEFIKLWHQRQREYKEDMKRSKGK